MCESSCCVNLWLQKHMFLVYVPFLQPVVYAVLSFVHDYSCRRYWSRAGTASLGTLIQLNFSSQDVQILTPDKQFLLGGNAPWGYLIMSGDVFDCLGLVGGWGGEENAKHSPVHTMAPNQEWFWPQMPGVPRLRHFFQTETSGNLRKHTNHSSQW